VPRQLFTLSPGALIHHRRGPDLTEEERTSIFAAPEFLDFVEQSSKIVQRALNDNYDYIRDYSIGTETGGCGSLSCRRRGCGINDQCVQRRLRRQTRQACLHVLGREVLQEPIDNRLGLVAQGTHCPDAPETDRTASKIVS
jgi:hypothetical protein